MVEVLRTAREETTDEAERRWVDTVLARADRSAQDRAADAEEVEGRTSRARRAVELRRAVLVAQRQALVAAEESGDVDEDAVREALEQLDLDEASLVHRGSSRL